MPFGTVTYFVDTRSLASYSPMSQGQPATSCRCAHDADFSQETKLLTTTAVDDIWSAGCVGLYRYPGGSSIRQYDELIDGECEHEVRENQ